MTQSNRRPLVSILMPAYNAEKWIADSLRSAIAQTWTPTEIIVVNDGSTDRTEEIARRFEPQGVRVYNQANAGAAAARNKAFSLCRGDYIQWLDADDLLAPDKIARQMRVALELQDERLLLSGAYARFRYRYHRAKFIPGPMWRTLSPVEWLLAKLAQNAYMQTSTWLVPRRLAEAAGPWDTTLQVDDDGEYFCRVLLASNEVRFVPEARVYYRITGASSLSYIGLSSAKLEAYWHSMQLHISYLRSMEDNERVRRACVRYLQNNIVTFYSEKPHIIKQMEQLCNELGAELGQPHLTWKYALALRLFGWRATTRLALVLSRSRTSCAQLWEKTLFAMESAGARNGIPIPDGTNPIEVTGRPEQQVNVAGMK